MADTVGLLSEITAARMAELDAANLPADVTAVLADTADMQPKLGTPAADVSADIAAVKAETALIVEDTSTTIPGTITTMQGNVTDILADTSTNGVVTGVRNAAAKLEAGVKQVVTTTWDLLRAGAGAGTDVLLTGTTQAVILESLIIRMPLTADITDGDPITSIAIATDDAEPGIIMTAADCPVASLTPESQFAWMGQLYIPVGTEIEGTLAGGDADAECLVIVTATYRAVVSGGALA